MTTTWKLRSAGVLAVLYLLCVLAPAIAFGAADAVRMTHCLTDSAHTHDKKSDGQKTKGAAHAHQDGVAPDHDHMGDAAAVDSQCCGLFCASSITAGPAGVDLPALPASLDAPRAHPGVTGKAPETLYRPPIAPLSI